jgi:hypothetical protein
LVFRLRAYFLFSGTPEGEKERTRRKEQEGKDALVFATKGRFLFVLSLLFPPS